MKVQGYKKKTKRQLLKAIDECKTISQLCALVQLEGIVIQMRCQSGASCVPPKKLSQNPNEINQSPLEKMKKEIRETVERTY